YHREVDRFSRFLDECVVFEPWDEVKVAKQDVRRTYELWCRENGVKPLGAQEFFDRLCAAGAEDGKSHGVRVWKRMRLLGPNEEPRTRGTSGDVSSGKALGKEMFGDRPGKCGPARPPCPPDDDEEREAIQEEMKL